MSRSHHDSGLNQRSRVFEDFSRKEIWGRFRLGSDAGVGVGSQNRSSILQSVAPPSPSRVSVMLNHAVAREHIQLGTWCSGITPA